MIERDGVATKYLRWCNRIEDRVSRILLVTAAGIASPFVRGYLEDLRKWDNCGPHDFRRMLNLAHYTTAALIEYTPDPPNVDVFKSLEVVRREAAVRPNRRGKGDCGTYTSVEGTMLGAWGVRVGCRLIAQGKGYDHVFCLADVPGLGVVCLDASTRITMRPGQCPPRSKFWAHRDFWFDNLDEWCRWWLAGADESSMPAVL